MNHHKNPLRYSIHSRLRAHHLARMIGNSKHGRFLDVGCGLGFLTEVLGSGFHCRLGLEYDMASVAANAKRSIHGMVQGDAARLPYQDSCVDVIVCSELLEHLPDGQDAKALAEMARVLKPGGRLLITVPSMEGLRATSRLRNLGHDDPNGGEYHYRQGYAWPDIQRMIQSVEGLQIRTRRYSMFLFAELCMDLLKLVYFRNNNLKEHADIMNMKSGFIYILYKMLFPVMFGVFLLEDSLCCPIFAGHILILDLTKSLSVNNTNPPQSNDSR